MGVPSLTLFTLYVQVCVGASRDDITEDLRITNNAQTTIARILDGTVR